MSELRPQTPADDEAVRRFEDESTEWKLVESRVPQLDAVTRAAQVLREDEASLEAAVVEARRAGASWRTIGLSAGMTRQGATQRWSRVDPVAVGS